MKKTLLNPDFFRKSLLIIFSFSTGISFSQVTSIESQINTEFQLLKQIVGNPSISLIIDVNSKTSSEAEPMKGKITFKIKELNSITEEIGEKYRRDMIRLILAHEYGHQIQFRYNDGQTNLAYECQADIIAGYLLFRLNSIETGEWSLKNKINDALDPRYKKRLAEWGDRLNASLTAIFKEGSNYVSNPSHPTSDERRLALRDGYNYGNVWLFSEQSENSPPSTPNLEMNRGIGNRFKSMLGFLPQDDLNSWSRRHTAKILHTFTENCRNIVIYTNYDIDSLGATLNVKYRQQITNTGKKIITFNYLNQVYNSNLDDPKNTLYWELAGTANHSLTLKPGETRYIEGTLEFLSSYNYKCFFIYPGVRGSLYSCTTLSDNNSEKLNTHFSFSVAKQRSDEMIMEAFLKARDLLGENIGGVGISEEIMSTNEISYISKLQLSSASSTNIVFNKGKSSYDVYARYYQGMDYSKAQQSLEYILQPIAKLKYKAIKASEKGKNKKWNILDTSNQIVGLIGQDYSPSFQEYTIYLKILGK